MAAATKPHGPAVAAPHRRRQRPGRQFPVPVPRTKDNSALPRIAGKNGNPREDNATPTRKYALDADAEALKAMSRC